MLRKRRNFDESSGCFSMAAPAVKLVGLVEGSREGPPETSTAEELEGEAIMACHWQGSVCGSETATLKLPYV
jgi:hypothetical protein